MRVRLRLHHLQELVARSPLSQNHWAIKLGLSRGHWSEILHGRYPYLSPKTRDRLLEEFGVSFDALFEIEAAGPAPAPNGFEGAIADRYVIDAELGHGGMGTVYLAREVRHGRPVALKVIAPEAVSGIGAERFSPGAQPSTAAPASDARRGRTVPGSLLTARRTRGGAIEIPIRWTCGSPRG
jgi:transcriptional regulator with XRE-family HTH domain